MRKMVKKVVTLAAPKLLTFGKTQIMIWFFAHLIVTLR